MSLLGFKLAEPVVDYSYITRHAVFSIFRMMLPFDCPEYGDLRVGGMFDGGYIMKDDFENIDAAYSLGINDDVSWDTDIANRGIDVYQYDHTIPTLPHEHTRFKWKKIGISDANSDDGIYQALRTVIYSNGHIESSNLILKCDIEGFELPVFANAEVDLIRKFRQIVIEMHAFQEIANPVNCNLIRRAVRNLTASHHVTHIHANNWAPWAILGGKPVPTVLEITLFRKDRGKFTASTKTFPTKLDMPCNPNRPDYELDLSSF